MNKETNATLQLLKKSHNIFLAEDTFIQQSIEEFEKDNRILSTALIVIPKKYVLHKEMFIKSHHRSSVVIQGEIAIHE